MSAESSVQPPMGALLRPEIRLTQVQVWAISTIGLFNWVNGDMDLG